VSRRPPNGQRLDEKSEVLGTRPGTKLRLRLVLFTCLFEHLKYRSCAILPIPVSRCRHHLFSSSPACDALAIPSASAEKTARLSVQSKASNNPLNMATNCHLSVVISYPSPKVLISSPLGLQGKIRHLAPPRVVPSIRQMHSDCTT
jgi:hypothetical protein